MIESFLSIEDIHKRPYIMFVWAFAIGTAAVLISNAIGYQIQGAAAVNLSGMFTVLFIVFPAAYIITAMVNSEESVEEEAVERHLKKNFWQMHRKYIVAMLFFFFGLSAAFALWTMVMPADFFQVQMLKINQIQGKFTGEASAIALNFNRVFSNNLQVMFFAFLFSFIFGAGAIFVIVWNASILGVYIGQISESAWQIPMVSLRFLPHGIPEIAAYLISGLAGGLISAAVLRGHHTRVIERVGLDSLKLMAVAIALVALAAFVEVYL